MNAIRHFKNTLLAQWLLHALLLWVGATAYILLFYYYRIVDNGGYYIFYEDGTPFTLWDRFYDLNVRNFFWAQVLLFTLFVETLRRWGYEQRSLRNLLLWIFFTGFLVMASMGVYVYISEDQNWKALSDPMPWILFVLYSTGYIVLRGFIRHKLYRKDVQLAQSTAHLESLRAQVNPHFFFNTCNYIYGMALRENAPQTAKAMEMMSAMMRYSMTVIDENEVLLSEELTFIRHYIELQKIRIAQKDAIHIDVRMPDLQGQTLKTAPMLLIPLVENAFKYGISVDRPSFITIVIQVQGEELTASIENSVHAHEEADRGMGSGLANITRRLQLLYPNRHTFTITHSATAFSVYLRLMTVK